MVTKIIFKSRFHCIWYNIINCQNFSRNLRSGESKILRSKSTLYPWNQGCIFSFWNPSPNFIEILLSLRKKLAWGRETFLKKIPLNYTPLPEITQSGNHWEIYIVTLIIEMYNHWKCLLNSFFMVFTCCPFCEVIWTLSLKTPT